MTNSEKRQLIQQHEDPNWSRIKSLTRDGMDWDTAEEVDRLERREAVLTQLGAAGELTDAQRDELDTVQSELLDLVGSPHTTFVGTSFADHAGDGAPAGTEPVHVDEDDQDDTSVEGTRAMMEKRSTELRLCADFLMDHARIGDDAPLRIAIRHAEKAKELEDRIDAALLAAIKRETVPAP
jgi:hypothetical protein